MPRVRAKATELVRHFKQLGAKQKATLAVTAALTPALATTGCASQSGSSTPLKEGDGTAHSATVKGAKVKTHTASAGETAALQGAVRKAKPKKECDHVPAVTGQKVDGVDLSNNNSDSEFEHALHDPQFRFVFLKATDGKTYQDPTFSQRYHQTLDAVHTGKKDLVGVYHFQEPYENGRVQAKWFLHVTGLGRHLPDGVTIADDVEANALSKPGYTRGFEKVVHNRTGVWPIIYSSEDPLPMLHQLVPQAPLWAADPTPPFDTAKPFVQYTWSPMDEDWFTHGQTSLRKAYGHEDPSCALLHREESKHK